MKTEAKIVRTNRRVEVVRFVGFADSQLYVRRIGNEMVVRNIIPRYVRPIGSAANEGTKYDEAFREKVVGIWTQLRRKRGSYRNVKWTLAQVQSIIARAEGVKIGRSTIYRWARAEFQKGTAGLVDGRTKRRLLDVVGTRGRVL